jgi:uncharacterized SAM-binding protein YcdF (DUF218 family)
MLQKPTKTNWLGLLSYQPRWGLTLKGWVLILLTILIALSASLLKLESFLAYSTPIDAELLVVEGWVSDDAVKGAMAEFKSRPSYKLLVTTGIRLGRGEYLSEYKSFAELSAATFITLGFDRDKLQAIPSSYVKKDRTLTSAQNLKKWLDRTNFKIRGINVYTADVHSRRSLLLFKKVFEPQISVGAIAHPPVDYDAQLWWNSSQGFKSVLSETIAYIYARFLHNVH